MPRIAAGLLMYRMKDRELQVLLAHPGGPVWKRKDDGVWTIPKGEPAGDEELLAVAQREFEEETGLKPRGPFTFLGHIKQKGGKVVHAWAFEGDCDPSQLHSNEFEMEWPPKSGKMQSYPEVDRAEFFSIAQARRMIKDAQIPLLDALLRELQGIRHSRAGGNPAAEPNAPRFPPARE